MNTLTHRQTRLFLALAQTGSVSAAARLMLITQPTASMQLREITSTVGMPLYEVISRRVRLTEAGLELRGAPQRHAVPVAERCGHGADCSDEVGTVEARAADGERGLREAGEEHGRHARQSTRRLSSDA